MEFEKQIIQEAASIGSLEVSKALSKLAGAKVTATASSAELLSYDFIADSMKSQDQQSIITYAQLIEGVDGVSLLLISREQALALVDILNNREVGTTGVLLDFDRSAVKETLNILSNAYLTALSRLSKSTLVLGSPYMLPASSLENFINRLKNKDASSTDKALVFQTNLEIQNYKIKSSLFLIFNENFVQLIKQVK